MYTQWLLQQPRTITLYTHESVYTQCFPVRFALRKTGASLSIEMTVALKVLWFTDLATPSQSSWAKIATPTASFELPSESTSGQSTYQVWDKWPTCQTADQSATQTLNCDNTSRPLKNSSSLKLNSSTRHKPNGCHPSPSSTRLGWREWDLAWTSPPWEAPGRNRLSSVLLLNPVRLLLLLVEVVSSALVGVAEGVSPLSF